MLAKGVVLGGPDQTRQEKGNNEVASGQLAHGSAIRWLRFSSTDGGAGTGSFERPAIDRLLRLPSLASLCTKRVSSPNAGR